MIHQISELIRNKIESLCWVERYAGNLIACPIKVRDKVFYFPVTCDMSAEECNKYKDFYTPSIDKCSIVYTETIGGSKYFNNKGIFTNKGSFIINTWVNTKKLGLDCSSPFEFELINCLEGKRINENKYQLVIDSVVSKGSDRSYFSSFSYASDLKSFTYPYVYFTLEVNYTLLIANGCIEPIECGEPIECIKWNN